MTPSRISLSALLEWNRCQRAHYLGHELRLRPRERPGPLGSGSAIHAVLNRWLFEHPCVAPTQADLEPLLVSALQAEFGTDGYEKYVKGGLNSLSLVPTWVWENCWHTETPLTIATIGSVTIHGRADLWAEPVEPDGPVNLFDFKVSQTDPLEMLIWAPQIRYYALGLQRQYPDRAIMYNYILLPTQGKRALDATSWPFTRRMSTDTMQDLTQLTSDFFYHQLSAGPSRFDAHRPAYTRSACGYCDFRKICIAKITGADVAGVIKENFSGTTRDVNPGIGQFRP